MGSVNNVGITMSARIRALAKESKIEGRVLLTRFAQERLLFRFQNGPDKDRFVLKGGMLFMCKDEGSNRPTEDVDLHDVNARDLEVITQAVKEAASTPGDDGVVFDVASLSSVRIREGFRPGTRIIMNAIIGNSVVRVKLDICSGDELTPAPVIRNLPSALPKHFGPLPMPSYSWETVIAEKFHAMTSFGLHSTRMKDWYDIATIAQEETVDGRTVVEAICRTFSVRGTQIERNTVALSDEFVASKSSEFARWVRNISAPEQRKTLSVVMDSARDLLSPVLEAIADGQEFDATWTGGTGWEARAAALRP